MMRPFFIGIILLLALGATVKFYHSKPNINSSAALLAQSLPANDDFASDTAYCTLSDELSDDVLADDTLSPAPISDDDWDSDEPAVLLSLSAIPHRSEPYDAVYVSTRTFFAALIFTPPDRLF